MILWQWITAAGGPDSLADRRLVESCGARAIRSRSRPRGRAVSPPRHEVVRVAERLALPIDEFEIRATPSGGPGGQHANRAHTRVEIRFDVAASATLSEAQRDRILAKLGPVVTSGSSDERSQRRNRATAVERMAERLADALHVDPIRRPTRPSRGSVTRRLATKQRASVRKAERRMPGRDD